MFHPTTRQDARGTTRGRNSAAAALAVLAGVALAPDVLAGDCPERDGRGGARIERHGSRGDGMGPRQVGAAAWRGIVETTPEQLRESPELFYGDRVSVIGEIEETFGSRVLTIDSRSADADLLVVLPRGIARIDEGETVRVVGTLRRLDTRDLEREFSWFDASLIRDRDIDLDEHRSVVIAGAIVSSAGRENFPESYRAGAGRFQDPDRSRAGRDERRGGSYPSDRADREYLGEGDDFGRDDRTGAAGAWRAEDDDGDLDGADGESESYGDIYGHNYGNNYPRDDGDDDVR